MEDTKLTKDVEGDANAATFVNAGSSAAATVSSTTSSSSFVLFTLDGVGYRSVEHYYQATKYSSSGHAAAAAAILSASTALAAKKLNTDLRKKFTCDSGFFSPANQRSVMLRGVQAKFEQNPALRSLLVSTGDRRLHETRGRSKDIWCYQPDGSADMLGQILEQVRGKIRSATPRRMED